MTVAVLAALLACALWALPYLAPELVDNSAFELTLVRYLFFGLSSVAMLATLRLNPFRELDLRGWGRVIGLGLAGNTLYYVLLSLGIQSAGPVPVALILAGLPVLMIIVGNLRRKAVPWNHLAGPVLLLGTGIGLTVLTAEEPSEMRIEAGASVGLVFAALAVISWLVYGVWNAEYLSDHPTTKTVVWASFTGLGTLVTLPLVYGADLILRGTGPSIPQSVDWPLIFWGAALGIGASWVATWAWGYASVRLPAALLGVIIVGETLFVILYDSVLSMSLPSLLEWSVIVLIVAGVSWGVLVAQRNRG